MTWTYFTAYLDGTKPITAAQRDELLDKFKAVIESCPGGYTIDTTDLAAVKNSGLIAERVKSSAGSPGFSGLNISGAMVYVAGVFSPSGEAVLAAAAGAEGLTTAEYNEIFDAALYRNRKTIVDDYRIWNILKRAINALECADPAATYFTCRSRSASKTKCGYPEWAGYESTPPKMYRTKTLAGTIGGQTVGDEFCIDCNSKVSYSYSGSYSFATPACTETGAGSEETTVYPDCITPDAPTTSTVDDVGAGFAGFTASYSSTVKTVTGDGCAAGSAGGHNFTGSASVTHSDEYTTAALVADVDTALAAASWSSYGATCNMALYDLSSDEMTVTKQAIDYKFEFAAVGAGYKIAFDVFSFTTGLVSHQCFALSAGATQYIYSLNPPSSPDALFVTNILVSAGSC